MRSCRIAALLGAIALPAAAQAPPGTDLWTVSLAIRAGRPVPGTPARLTDRPGYDNQAFFALDGRSIFFTSVRGAAGTQSDIFRIDLRSGAETRVTGTPESEYSPTPIPGGGELAVVRVEADSTQRLWAFPLAGGPPRLLLEKVKPVGYQAWLDRNTVGLFVLGSPPVLVAADLRTGTARPLLADIGRSLQPMPGGAALSVVQRVAEGVSWLTEVNPNTGAVRRIARMPEGADYVVWLRDGSALTATGRSLLHLRPGRDSAFAAVATLDLPGPISRLAVSPRGDRLALVVAESRP